MKLYYAPGACSLADHIALEEAGLSYQTEKVDLKAKKTEAGADFWSINPKGYVPALELDSGEVLTENVALLSWIAEQAPQLTPPGSIGRIHLLEALAYISTELHKNFKPFFAGGSDAEKAAAGETITRRLRYLAGTMAGDYLFGARLGVADAYLFVMLLWSRKNGVMIPDPLPHFLERMLARPAVQKVLKAEGLG